MSRSFESDAAEGNEGIKDAKAKLFDILGSSASALTADEVWSRAQVEGFKSKRFTKRMLQDMKAAGHVVTQPSGQPTQTGGHTKRKVAFAYTLRAAPAPARQQPEGVDTA